MVSILNICDCSYNDLAKGSFLMSCLYIWLQCSRENENILIKTVIKKVGTFLSSFKFMVLSKDTKNIGPKKNPDPDNIIKKNLKNIKTKTIVFIRHGESDWNDIFNKDSKFLDSPLNQEGIQQALELREFIESSDKNPGNTVESKQTKEILQILKGTSLTSSVIVASNLRRCISTSTLALWKRIESTGEKMLLLSSLQEISRNVDTMALAPANSVADLPFSRIAHHCVNSKTGDEFNPENVYDCSGNHGNKSLTNTGIKRMSTFNEWAFSRSEDVIIVGGHSLWFKSYFQTYMSHSSNHDAKSKKIENSGVVSFTLQCANDDGVPLYRVDTDSINKVYRGFTTK